MAHHRSTRFAKRSRTPTRAGARGVAPAKVAKVARSGVTRRPGSALWPGCTWRADMRCTRFGRQRTIKPLRLAQVWARLVASGAPPGGVPMPTGRPSRYSPELAFPVGGTLNADPSFMRIASGCLARAPLIALLEEQVGRHAAAAPIRVPEHGQLGDRLALGVDRRRLGLLLLSIGGGERAKVGGLPQA